MSNRDLANHARRCEILAAAVVHELSTPIVQMSPDQLHALADTLRATADLVALQIEIVDAAAAANEDDDEDDDEEPDPDWCPHREWGTRSATNF